MCQDKWQSQDSNRHSLAPKPVPLTTTKCHPLHAHLILKQPRAQKSRYHDTYLFYRPKDWYPKMVNQLHSRD